MNSTKGVSLIALIITIIVIIILAAIVLSSGGDTTNMAQLAVYVNNMSQYADRVAIDSLNLKQSLSVNQRNVNDAQLNYMTANGLKSIDDIYIMELNTPIGYIMPDTLMEIYGFHKRGTGSAKLDSTLSAFLNPTAYAETQLGSIGGSEDKLSYEIVSSYERPPIVAYVIDDANITGYNSRPNNLNGSAGYEFYGDTNGEEYHFITSNGHVFTLPGFATTQEDGTIQYTISHEKGAYYIVKGQSGLEIGSYNTNGDKVNEERPILALDLANLGVWGATPDGYDALYYVYYPEYTNFGLPGRYTCIGDPTEWAFDDGGPSGPNDPGDGPIGDLDPIPINDYPCK